MVDEYCEVGLMRLKLKLDRLPTIQPRKRTPLLPEGPAVANRHNMNGGAPLAVRNQTLTRFLLEGRKPVNPPVSRFGKPVEPMTGQLSLEGAA